MGVVRYHSRVWSEVRQWKHPVVMNIPHMSKWGITGGLVDARAIGVHDEW